MIQVAPPFRLQSLSGAWMEHKVFFSLDPRSKTWYGIAGTGLRARPARYPLSLSGVSENGKQASAEQVLLISKGKYRSVALSVPRKFTQPSPDELRQIAQEKNLKKDVLSLVSPDRLWAGTFLPPVGAVVSDTFGTARTFNGKTESIHEGLDYAVPPGTPVRALNRGKVLLAQALFFEGNCVVLDHGQGLLTLYLHLSALAVKEGDIVGQGQQIGLSGGTGRATGPHLHIAVRWQGVYLNPATLLSLQLP